MAYIYSGEMWCDDCAEAIIADLKKNLHVDTGDSNEWPQEADEDAPHDSVHNCASGDCGGQGYVVGADPGMGAMVSYGKHLELPLSGEGYNSLQKMLNGHGMVLPPFAQEWADYYGFTWHMNPWVSSLDWLHDNVRSLWPVGLQADGLWNVIKSLLGMVDSDQVQDAFQDEMEADGYFKKQGWYSNEME